MSAQHKLSLKSAIFMNINIIAGAGLFINTVLLTKLTGIFSCLAYLLVGVFMLPLITSIAQLVRLHPSGGFYAFIRPISPFLAFMACWIYFFSKLASGALILYVAAGFLQQVFPVLSSYSTPQTLSLIILLVFTYLNLFNIQVGSMIQKLFFGAKTVPIIFAILVGIWMLDISQISAQSLDFIQFSSSIPFVLYCLAGFEAACSISRKIENPRENAPKAIFYSFFIVIVTYTVFQFFVSMMLLPHIQHITSYTEAFGLICQRLHLSPAAQHTVAYFINLMVSLSALGGAYGILFSNSWNLYTLAEYGHTPMPDQITRLNAHHIPTLAVLIESLICLVFILITHGSQIPLQQTAAFGATIAYGTSVIALLRQIKQIKISHILALITCTGLLISCVLSTITHGITSLLLLTSMAALGAAMYRVSKKRP